MPRSKPLWSMFSSLHRTYTSSTPAPSHNSSGASLLLCHETPPSPPSSPGESLRARGRIDDERLSALLAETLPQAVDGPEARDWIAEHDMIDRGLLEKAVAGPPARRAAGGRGGGGAARPAGGGGGGGGWRPGGPGRGFGVAAPASRGRAAECSPGREHVH